MSLKYSLIFALCLAAVALSNTERARYDNYRVYRVTASNLQELAFLKEMEDSSDALIFLEGVHSVDKDIDVVVAPHKVPDFLKALIDHNIDYVLLEQNLQSRLEDDDDTEIRGRAGAYGWEEYQTLTDTYTWLRSLTSSYPGVVRLIEGGKTYEKRSILGVKISYNNGAEKKPGIFLEAGIHAREWIAPATATYIINQLLTSEDAAIKDLFQNYDWYIFPHANPDGYVYTHTTDRLWRKTRQPHGTCYGADPNRNWDFHWNTVGASSNPCSDTYAGPSAFSELEAKSLSNYIQTLEGKIDVYISFHSYSQYVLYPYGHTQELPANVNDYKRVFNVTVAAIAERYGTKYTGGNIYDAIYPAAGASVDWVYGNVGTRMSFCLELRPGPNSILTGFRLPAAQIIPTGEETLDGVVALVNEVKALGYFV
ncbi:zinc carboxypeptidase A 1-like [Rhagoletis pomonella]|uniref:zinc carboxypeptidase A 1-like n=1 Tax=Rhagoletis pomonella TaxID=28610 RepID=UPI00177B014B|nr:zinc carboxypeptidase A 1-like [Rhagoletis pomonella]